MTIGERIKARRKELNLTVDALAERLQKSRATIYRYESNEIENMPVSILKPIADALRTTPSFLMGWDEDEAGDIDTISEQNSDCELNINKTILAVVELMEQEDTRTQRYVYELVRDYLNCNEFERGRLNTSANLKAERTLADKVQMMKQPEDITEVITDIKEAK
ncbi:helix-turn-helix domain-containing protein [Emergencia sp.]|uniref:helix-turn-helix domain-containing protein n=1 Tax=Emergencia sp. TaxID=1926557 RepID=UPI003AF17A4D